jgi:anti-sigma regulatory factor (Ser/Thr protein kinase)
MAERTMREWSLTELEEPVTAITAELIANAVLHARTELELQLSLEDLRVRIEVSDHAPHPPVVAATSPLQEGGRGMALIAWYATDWGVTPTPGGKTVWAEIEPAFTAATRRAG